MMMDFSLIPALRTVVVAAAGLLLASAPAAAFGAPRGAGGLPPGAEGVERDISEQEHALRRRESGQLRPFDELLTRAQSVGRGEYLGVEPDLASSTYRFKFLRPGANVIWVDVDGRTGRVLSARP